MTATQTVAAVARSWFDRANQAIGTSVFDRVIAFVMFVCIALGLAFRARGFLFEGSGFWLDEAVWAMNLTERPLVQNLIRPPAFILVSKALAQTLGPTETVLRGLPWLAGVATALASPVVARRLFQAPASRLLFVAAVSLNSCAIDFSKEFKPYSIGLFLHLAVVFVALRYVETRRGVDLGWALGIAAVGSLFTQDLIFAFPGLFLILGWEAYRQRRKHLPVIALGAVILIALLLAQYFLLWRHIPKDSSDYWGNKYNVFHTAQHTASYLEWSFERYRDMTGLPGIRRDYWQNGGVTFEQRQLLRNIDRVLWLSMHLMGLMVIVWRRRFREAGLLLLPLIVLWTFNALGLWPMGSFRTNVFSLGYLTAIAAMAFDVPDAPGKRWLAIIPTALLVLLPFAFFEHVWHARKQAFTYDSRLPQLMRRLAAMQHGRPEVPLILDRRSCQPWRFYAQYHPTTSVELRDQLEKGYDIHCLTDDSRIPSELYARSTSRQAVWIVLHAGHERDRMIRQRRLPDVYRISRFEVGPHTVMSFRRRLPRAWRHQDG